MKRWAWLAVGLVMATTPARANLGESKAEIEKRWGAPIKITGYPDERVYTYRWGALEIAVGFLDGTSQEETYRPAEKSATLEEAVIQQLLAANSLGKTWREESGDYVTTDGFLRAAVFLHDKGSRSLFLRTDAHDRWSIAQQPAARTGKKLTFSGPVHLRTVENGQWLVLKSGENVLEIPWTISGYRDAPAVAPDGNSTVTLIDVESIDIATRVACLSDREHKDWGDAVYDSKFFLLKRIEAGGRVLFDRAVCEVHHARMTALRVPVEYGLIGTDAAERLFPHQRKFALGGCLVGEEKTAVLYICPKCIADAAEYRRQHPSPEHS